MNLTFGICWIEDQASDAEVEAVEEAVRGNGFEPQIERVEDQPDIESISHRQHHFQDFDLILLDLRLGDGLRGDDLAPEIRQAFRSTPILFYSAQDEDSLRRMMAAKLVEGAYCAHRDRLSIRVGELVSDLSPALNRLSSMRGLAARIVAECDQELRLILVHLAGQVVTEETIVNSLKERIRSSGEEQFGRISQIQELASLLDDHAVTSGALFHETRDLLRKNSQSDEILAILRSIKNYPNDILNRRNTLAHALEERTENGWRIVRRGSSKPLTVADFQRYRSGFLSHLRLLRDMRGLLVGE